MNPTARSRSISLIRLLRYACAGMEILITVGLVALAFTVAFAESSVRSGSRIMIFRDTRNAGSSYMIHLSRHKSVSVTNLTEPALASADTGKGSVSFGPFILGAGKAGQPAGSGAATDKDVHIQDVEGTLVFSDPETAIGALRAVKWPAVFSEVCAILTGLGYFEILRRLLLGAEKGELFTDSNVRILRIFGLALVVIGILRFAAAAILVSRMNSYVAPHVADGTVVLVNSVTARISGIISGATMLLLAEVFREGLKFRRDSDLTI